MRRKGTKPEPDWYIEKMKLDPLTQDDLLYDLKADPGEKTNRASKDPERVQMMQKRLAELRESKSTR